ncbi:hypothetical protein CONLIGDRAFT_687758 [Coniochaeta ligniaria NRRL 30616]|uniref:Uncharacterized protein n=1 Tax=Coniochaeta ligniaria NRRL 30616 TaxID=1408157 RepID=A0A1J7IX99_9PEZI|nr:hypothetical protein CONLIGDRAFT_687758 [Coniochaeta ligniaria NRRL 30616]
MCHVCRRSHISLQQKGSRLTFCADYVRHQYQHIARHQLQDGRRTTASLNLYRHMGIGQGLGWDTIKNKVDKAVDRKIRLLVQIGVCSLQLRGRARSVSYINDADMMDGEVSIRSAISYPVWVAAWLLDGCAGPASEQSRPPLLRQAKRNTDSIARKIELMRVKPEKRVAQQELQQEAQRQVQPQLVQRPVLQSQPQITQTQRQVTKPRPQFTEPQFTEPEQVTQARPPVQSELVLPSVLPPKVPPKLSSKPHTPIAHSQLIQKIISGLQHFIRTVPLTRKSARTAEPDSHLRPDIHHASTSQQDIHWVIHSLCASAEDAPEDAPEETNAGSLGDDLQQR